MYSFHTILYVFLFLYIALHCFNLLSNKFQTPVWGHIKIPGESVTGIEIGFQSLWDSSCIPVKGDRLRMLTDVQACWHNSTVHMCKGVSCLEGRADNHDIIRWCHCCYAYVEVRGLHKGAHMSPGALIWVFDCSTFGCTLLGATYPLLQLPHCLSREWDYNLTGKCPLFIQL